MGVERVDAAKIDALHSKLRDLVVRLPADPSSVVLRRLFSEVRDRRNVVAKILGWTLPRLGRLRSMAVRLKRTIEAESALVVDGREGLIGVRNDKERVARVRVRLSPILDEAAVVEEDLAILVELAAHARLVLEELRDGFNEASRSLASLEFERRVEQGSP